MNPKPSAGPVSTQGMQGQTLARRSLGGGPGDHQGPELWAGPRSEAGPLWEGRSGVHTDEALSLPCQQGLAGPTAERCQEDESRERVSRRGAGFQ